MWLCCLFVLSDETRARAVSPDGQILAGAFTLQRPMDMLVNGFWDRLSALRDYAAVCKHVLKLAVPHADKKIVGKKKAMIADEDRQVSTYTQTMQANDQCASAG